MSDPAALYSPRLAWFKASIYFAACLVIAYFSGALQWVLQTPLAESAQLDSSLWWVLTGGSWLVIVVGYGVIWPRGTFTDGRPRHALLSLVYGATWGACQALWFLSLWQLAEKLGLQGFWLAAASYLLIGGYNGVWHRFVWDIQVSPPHNYTEWNARKVLLCHTPNLLITLSCLALFGSASMFVLLQATALALSACAMHFPAPWDDYHPVAGQERTLAGKSS